ncbi:MAG: response regulator transcription factor [Bacteriovoracaceae bacterium]|nr:response regulator transcription factor [Bacteriovoracaceae bacterium]
MSAKKNLWIIEDMEDLQPVYHSILESDKYDLKFFTSFDDFKNAYANNKDGIDLIIADIYLEDGHFFQLLNESDMTLNTPYLVISGSDEYETICNAFEAGAIDFILKPFNKNEIRAKVEKHLHHIEEKAHETSKSLEALNLDLTQFTNKEIKIIESFNIQEDKTLHRNDIVKVIWKNIAIHPNTLDVHIYNLRKKLKLSNYSIKAIGNGLFKFVEL